jgi:hypothetical protein
MTLGDLARLLAELSRCKHPTPITPHGSGLRWCRPCGAIQSIDAHPGDWIPSRLAREAQKFDSVLEHCEREVFK